MIRSMRRSNPPILPFWEGLRIAQAIDFAVFGRVREDWEVFQTHHVRACAGARLRTREKPSQPSQPSQVILEAIVPQWLFEMGGLLTKPWKPPKDPPNGQRRKNYQSGRFDFAMREG